MFTVNEVVNLKFPVKCLTKSQIIPYYHGYRLLGALMKFWPDVHGEKGKFIQIGNISGTYKDNGFDGEIILTDQSSLTMRMPISRVKESLSVVGKELALYDEYQGTKIALGKPFITQIFPASVLYSWCVSFKSYYSAKKGTYIYSNKVTKDMFINGLKKKMYLAGIESGNIILVETQKHYFYIKENKMVGWPVYLTGLTDNDSLKIQACGLAGRLHMGCGLMLPVVKGEIIC